MTRKPDYNRAKREAKRILADNFITSPPVPVADLLRNYVNDVVVVDFPDEHDNVSGMIHFGRNKVYINSDDPPNRQKFTLAHELGHIRLHDEEMRDNKGIGIKLRKPIGGEDDPLEKEANCFAANLLVPYQMLKPYKHLDPGVLAKMFGVSKDVIGYRLKQLEEGW